MKKAAFILAFALLAGLTQPTSHAESNLPGFSSPSHILIEETTGRVLSEQNADQRLSPASLTKIMLLIIVADEINAGRLSFDDAVTASENASSQEGSVIWLEAGEKMSVYDLVKSVVISSANDAAVALAEHIGGSEEEFVGLMNRRAYTLGMSSTAFVNCAGLDSPGHYTTARDVAAMSRALMRSENYSLFSELMLTRLSYVRENTDRETQLVNTNGLIAYYNGIEGLKTGTTDDAGFCLSASASRDGMRLISVVMGCDSEESRLTLSEELLDGGFEGYELHRPNTKEELGSISVRNGIERELKVTEESGGEIVIPKGRSGDVEYEIYLPQTVLAPIAQNQPVGTVTATLDGEVVYESYIVAAQRADELTFMKSFGLLIKKFFSL